LPVGLNGADSRPLLLMGGKFGCSLKSIQVLAALALFCSAFISQAQELRTDQPLVAQDVVFEEVDGQIVVEGEAFFTQTNIDKRAWHITSAAHTPNVGRDIDPPHFADASGGAYIEVLPDTGNDPVGPRKGESISDVGGEMAAASYRVHFNNPGRYFIWVRALGTDGDDNTLHFGMDGEWPTNSVKMHHNGGGKWGWACRHRQHKGRLWLDVTNAGPHVISLSMREDGCEVDRFVLTTNENFVAPTNAGPVVSLKSGKLPDFSAAAERGVHAASTSAVAGVSGSSSASEIAESKRAEARAPLAAERDGLIVLEAESASAGGWELATSKPGFSGKGYLRWTKSGQGRKAGEGVLSYSFRITTPGDYQFLWRTALPDPQNRPETPDPDGNDSWVRFVGGADVTGQRAFGNEWRKVALLGHPEGWSWSTHADQGPPHPSTPVCRAFAPGEYRVELCGRSAGHMIDQIILRRITDKPDSEMAGEAALSLSQP